MAHTFKKGLVILESVESTPVRVVISKLRKARAVRLFSVVALAVSRVRLFESELGARGSSAYRVFMNNSWWDDDFLIIVKLVLNLLLC